jgi:hypothetical protein
MFFKELNSGLRIALPLDRNQHEDVYKYIRESGTCQNPISNRRPIPPLLGALLACGCFACFIYVSILSGRFYVNDLSFWLISGGTIAALGLGMCSFCVLLWSGIL